MKKRIISLLLAAALLLALAPAAFAAGGYCGSNVRWSFDAGSGALVISGSGEMYDYGDMVSAPWANYVDSIRSITIESGVTSVGAGAFSRCSSATTLAMADTVTKIGGWAFHYCTALESLDLSESVTEIGNWAFGLCRSARRVELPQGLKTIGTGAFAYCAALEEIVIPSTVAEIGGWAFSSCTALKESSLPAGLGTVENGLYANCSALKTVSIPASVTVIGSSAFCGCTALEEAVYGGSSAGWSRVKIGDDNDGLSDAKIRCTGSGGDDPAPAPDPDPDPDEPFDDVTDADWFSDAVKYVYTHKLMDGVRDNIFDPYGKVNRAMTVTILWRLSGTPAVSGNGGFSDVSASMWYAAPVAWAAKNGVVDGFSDGTFRPLENVTREQAAALLYRLAKTQGQDLSLGADLSGFKDGGSVSAYAVDAVRWAVNRGILSADSSGRLEPKAAPNRAQLAVMLMRYCSAG